MVSNLSLALSLMPTPQQGAFDFSALLPGGGTNGAGQVFNAGNVNVALAQAEANEEKQLAQTRDSPTVKRELERYARVVGEAETLDDILEDPVARRVLMKAYGLGDQADYLGLAKKALASNPADPDSLANKLAGINGAWLEFANTYNIHENGITRLKAHLDGIEGKWALTVDRDGVPAQVELEIKQTDLGLQATIDGVGTAFEIEDNEVSINVLWEDADENLRITVLEGILKGGRLSGTQSESATETGSWSAMPYYADAITKVMDFYVAEVRLDGLDEQLPGLGTALLFKRTAASLEVLGSALGREVVTTALGLPKEIALQSLVAQEKAINQRLNVVDLQNPEFVDRLAQRYLIQLNGGQTGVTA